MFTKRQDSRFAQLKLPKANIMDDVSEKHSWCFLYSLPSMALTLRANALRCSTTFLMLLYSLPSVALTDLFSPFAVISLSSVTHKLLLLSHCAVLSHFSIWNSDLRHWIFSWSSLFGYCRLLLSITVDDDKVHATSLLPLYGSVWNLNENNLVMFIDNTRGRAGSNCRVIAF